MWAFLGSECVFFGSLITTFFVYRNVIISGASGEPLPRDVLGINFTALLAFILVTSSLTMVLAINAVTAEQAPHGGAVAAGHRRPGHLLPGRADLRVHQAGPGRAHPHQRRSSGSAS